MTNKEATKCPYCGSTNIKQKDKTSNQLLAKGLAFGFKQLTGLRASANGILSDMDRHYICNSCHKEWIGDGHNLTGLPEDQFQFQKLVSEICEEVYKFNTNEELMTFCWKIDSIVHGITYREEITGYSYEDEFEVSEEVKTKFLFLKNFASLTYMLNYLDKCNTDDFQQRLNLYMVCEAGLTGCAFVNNRASFDENDLCYNILLFLANYFFYESTEEDLNSILNDCSVPNSSSEFIFSADYWKSVIDMVKQL